MSLRRSQRRQKEETPETLDEEEVFIDTTCEICFAEFVEFADLQHHKDQVHPQEPLTIIEPPQPKVVLEKPPIFTGYDCFFCNDNYSNIEWLSLHIRDKHIKDLICCDYCLRVFTNDKKLKSHEQLHISTLNGVYSCSHCPMFLKTTTELQEHEYEQHKDIKPGVLLNDCFPHLSALLNMRVDEFLKALHRKSQLYTCVCDFKTALPAVYLDHLKKKGCTSLACNKCNRPYKNMKSLKKHLKKVSCSMKPTKRYCNTCKKDVPMLDFAVHRRRCFYAMACKFCSKTFRNIEELTTHQQEHAMVIVKKTCNYCRLDLYNLRVYKNHVEKCHGPNYQMYKYPCVHCERYIFNHPQKLFAHFYSSHKDISPYRCNICTKDFRIRKQFTLHIKMVHKSVGFVEFTEQLYVHFNAEKSVNAFVPVGPERLFDSEDEEEFKSNGLNTVQPKKVKKKLVKRKAEDSDDEPLIKKRNIRPINKLPPLQRFKKRSPRLICKICKKFCHTVQNYDRHVALHFKENNVNCVKCDATFKSKKALDKHLRQAHETTHITSKLKMLLEKHKYQGKSVKPYVKRPTITLKDTIKKVITDSLGVPATVKEVQENSAKNFLETFKPEVEKAEKTIEIDASISIKPVENETIKKPFSIKMVKCNLSPLPVTKKLKMPERVNLSNDLVQARIKIRPSYEPKPKNKLNFGVREDNNQAFIPEVAEEVVYEAKEEHNIHVSSIKETEVNDFISEVKDYAEIVIPDHYDPAQIKVATLHSEAPYFRIVPLAKLTKTPTIKEEYKTVDEIQLPTGTLVRSNPLAHLMKGKNVKFSKSYEPKLKNPQKALANAIMKLNKKEEQNVKIRKEKRAKKNTQKQTKSTANDEKQEVEVNNE